MATYEEIYGKRVKDFDSDPTLDSSYEGQVWYDKSSGTLRSVVAFESVTSQTSMTDARSGAAGAGSTTAGLVIGGNQSPPITNKCEEFNGSGFTNGGSLNTARQELGGAGTQTAGLGFGGYKTSVGAANESEEYDGSSWTEGNNLGTARYRVTGIGTQTAALACAGRGGSGPSPTPMKSDVEDYNGTSWTAGTALNTARQMAGAAGTNTAGLVCGGGDTPPSAGTTNTANSEEWNGTSWTEGNNMPTAKRAFAGQNGLQTAAIMMGGSPNATIIQTYDGTSWATSPATLVTARHNGAGTTGQPGTTGMAFGGYDPSNVTGATEEYNKSINTITAAAWASGGNLNTGRNGAGGAGPQTAGIIYGGQQNPGTASKAETEEYDGTSWTEVNNLNTARYDGGPSIGGTQTATIYFGGYRQSPDVNAYNNTETWDGTSWTEVNNLNTGRQEVAGSGTSTAALASGGAEPTITAKTESWDGTSWTEVNDLPSADRALAGAGTQTAALAFGGKTPPSATTFEFDGTNWTAGGNLNTARSRTGVAGIQTAALGFGGDTPSTYPAQTEEYDGTSWSASANLALGRQRLTKGSGSSTAALGSGGYSTTTASVTSTEEFTGATETATAKTLTTS
tara:strand:+ start:315 stop:2183 length:1869 start_codon:yes stop_codon:yes gene_type:complete